MEDINWSLENAIKLKAGTSKRKNIFWSNCLKKKEKIPQVETIEMFLSPLTVPSEQRKTEYPDVWNSSDLSKLLHLVFTFTFIQNDKYVSVCASRDRILARF